VAALGAAAGGGGGGAPATPPATLGWSLAAWGLVVVGLVLVGQRAPAYAYGTLALIVMYLLLTHAGEVSGQVNQLLRGFAAPLEAR
jgi:hypothetical protein